MTKKTEHSLAALLERSRQKQATEEQEDLLDKFMLSEYEKVVWYNTTMKNDTSCGSDKIQKYIAKKRISRYIGYGIAASIMVLLGLGLLVQSPVLASKMITLKTGVTLDSVHLVDGSIIYLAAHTVFEYPEHFDSKERNVNLLQGSAFFEIAKDPQHPFIISSGTVKTRVLGTSFHIQMTKTSCNVIVVTGKVNVSAKNQSLDLVANDEALFKADKLIKRKASKLLVVNWYNQDIELKNVKLNEVLELLKNKYNVTFEVKNASLLDTSLTLFIEKNASLENILKQMNYITNLKFETNDSTVTVN
jgi:ferric-dicitrate binding protein FerR (iron transport regulator)